MPPKIEKYQMRLRMESKAEENRAKPPLQSPDVAETAEFLFSRSLPHRGDSGPLLLAKRKQNRAEQYLVKHAYTDCACNEFVYTKLAQAMGYSMPDVLLLRLSPQEKRPYFATEYLIAQRYLAVSDPDPSYAKIWEQAENWSQYFSFQALYGITGEGDGLEILLAEDRKIYRVDTTGAFPVGNYYLDVAGITQEIGGARPSDRIQDRLLSMDFSKTLNVPACNRLLEQCQPPLFPGTLCPAAGNPSFLYRRVPQHPLLFLPRFHRRLFQAIPFRPARAVRSLLARFFPLNAAAKKPPLSRFPAQDEGGFPLP